jgi:type IV pilus assembly protein PilN
LLLVMIGLYLYYYVRLGNEEEQITQLDQDIAREQARIQELAPFRDLQARLDAKKPIADGIFRTRFPWDEFLRGLSFVIPESTALDNLVAQASPINIQAPAGGAPEVQNLEPPGSVTFTGVALPDYQNVSDFIVRMNNLRFLANADLDSAELDRERFARPAINFEVGAELVTRIGENGDEVLLGTEENGEGERDEENGAANEGAGSPGARASRAGVER